MTTFKELELSSEIIKSLDDLGFTTPSPIQAKAIPFILKSKKDLIALAQTGTGKTAAFSLPILNQIQEDEKKLLSIILCPTRELCLQISEDIKKFAKYKRNLAITAVYGGERIDFQIRALKKGTNIVVGTPGRVLDLIKRKVLNLESIKWLVLDEADEMLDMGFKEDLDAILETTPKTKQTLLFSATISRNVHNIARRYMQEAEEISAGEKNKGAEKVSHEYYIVQMKNHFEALQRILDSIPGVYGILFCKTKNQTQELAEMLKQANYNTEALHGDVSQVMRTKIMDRFKKKHIQLLVATDVAARGIDVNNLSHVINYNLPEQSEAYTHRSGRTGRAEKSGICISIISPRDTRKIKMLEGIIGKSFECKKVPNGQEIYQKQVNNFVEEIKENINEVDNEINFEEAIESLKKMKKEDLIKAIIHNKFSQLINSHKNKQDLNVKFVENDVRNNYASKNYVNDLNNVNLEINFGKNQNFSAKELFFLVNSNRELKGLKIGSIKNMFDFTLFSVDKNDVEKFEKFLNGTIFRGEKIRIMKSSKSFAFSGENRNSNRRGGSYKRNNFKGSFKSNNFKDNTKRDFKKKF